MKRGDLSHGVDRVHSHIARSSTIRPAIFSNSRSCPYLWIANQPSHRLSLQSWMEPQCIRQEIAYDSWGEITDQLVLSRGGRWQHIMATTRGLVVHDFSSGVS